MSEQTLRDTFAAAAMAVLDEIDRALRERARNGAPDARETVADHDAAPAARAEVAPGTGDTPKFTEAEREAIQTAIDILTDPVCRAENKKTATLRALLARHGGER